MYHGSKVTEDYWHSLNPGELMRKSESDSKAVELDESSVEQDIQDETIDTMYMVMMKRVMLISIRPSET
jgi:hypothetical protein